MKVAVDSLSPSALKQVWSWVHFSFEFKRSLLFGNRQPKGYQPTGAAAFPGLNSELPASNYIDDTLKGLTFAAFLEYCPERFQLREDLEFFVQFDQPVHPTWLIPRDSALKHSTL